MASVRSTTVTPSTKRANKAISGVRPSAWHGAALALGISLLASAAAAQGSRASGAPAGAPSAPQGYDQCLAMAHSNPQQAFTQATAWHDSGGGFPAQHCAAVALVGLKKYPEAAAQLEALAGSMMKAEPSLRAEAMEQAGQAWLLGSKPNEAKADFDAALAFKPNDPEILVDRAEAYALGGKLFEAVDDLNVVLDMQPKRTDALIYRASAYRQLGSLDLARDDAERALSIDPNAIAGLLERGNIRRMQGDDAGAKADWQRIVALSPNSGEAAAAKDNLDALAKAPGGQNLTTNPPAKKP